MSNTFYLVLKHKSNETNDFVEGLKNINVEGSVLFFIIQNSCPLPGCLECFDLHWQALTAMHCASIKQQKHKSEPLSDEAN